MSSRAPPDPERVRSPRAEPPAGLRLGATPLATAVAKFAERCGELGGPAIPPPVTPHPHLDDFADAQQRTEVAPLGAGWQWRLLDPAQAHLRDGARGCDPIEPSPGGGGVERWSGELTMKQIRRGTHTSVRALERDLGDWIERWNNEPRPYVWVKTAEQILDPLARYDERVTAAASTPSRQ